MTIAIKQGPRIERRGTFELGGGLQLLQMEDGTPLIDISGSGGTATTHNHDDIYFRQSVLYTRAETDDLLQGYVHETGVFPWGQLADVPALFAPAPHSHPWSEVDRAGSSLADLETRSASDLEGGVLADELHSARLPWMDAANEFTAAQTIHAPLAHLRLRAAASGPAERAWIEFGQSEGGAWSPTGAIGDLADDARGLVLRAEPGHDLWWVAGSGDEVLRAPAGGNLALFGSAAAAFEGGERTLFLGDAAAVPTGAPAGGGLLWSDQGTLCWSGGVRVRGAGGIALENGAAVHGADAAGTGTVPLVGLDADDVLRLGAEPAAAAVAGDFSPTHFLRVRGPGGTDVYLAAAAAAW